MRTNILAISGVLLASSADVAMSQAVPSGATPRTLAMVVAHADDESAAAPILARYAREGVHVHLIFATDGVAGAGRRV